MAIFNTTRAAVAITPTTTEILIQGIEPTIDGNKIRVRVIQKEVTAYGTKSIDEVKFFPIELESIIIGYNIENNEPVYDLEALGDILLSYGITLISQA